MPKQKKLPIFVIHRHDASHLHYDLRIERGGVLKSWAVPKEPPQDADIKRLAIQVEDHDLDYADFEGRIPDGLYGAGDVRIWDRGSYIPLKFEPAEIIVELKGKKLKGVYCLIKLKNAALGKGKNKNKNWLLFKKKK